MKVHKRECTSLLKNGLVGDLAAMFVLDPATLADNVTLKGNAGLDATPGRHLSRLLPSASIRNKADHIKICSLSASKHGRIRLIYIAATGHRGS